MESAKVKRIKMMEQVRELVKWGIRLTSHPAPPSGCMRGHTSQALGHSPGTGHGEVCAGPPLLSLQGWHLRRKTEKMVYVHNKETERGKHKGKKYHCLMVIRMKKKKIF